MKIYVKSSDGHRINLWFPTSLLATKWMLKYAKKYVESDVELLIDSLPTIYKTLKKYIKKHGHFTLIDLISSDGDKVIIRV